MPLKSIFPPLGQQAFLEVLAPYLPFRIDIYHPATNRFGLLRGLPGTYAGQQLPLADVEFYTDAEDAADGGGDLLEDVSKVLPVLYALEAGDAARGVDALRRAHVAVGLEPHQYHLKTACNGREVAPC